ncbi:MAG: ion transporter [Phycisphaerales bacterium]|nr:ion transporter [Phycisphaerae bacterium]NNF45008.1 ion transporter [Phycisphaerales bacterium]NNM26045.1 ion transporter [Phycisphaerales bacterium]
MPSRLQNLLHEIIFEADTRAGKAFDVGLLLAIVISIVAVALESVAEIRTEYGQLLRTIEWIMTILFTIEYVLRLYCVGRPIRYAVSFFGIIDLLSILPTYLSLFMVGTQSLLVIRALRLLRVFRVFKLAHFISEANVLREAMRSSLRKIIVFLGTVLSLILILGTLMYLVEGETSGFSSIPQSVYWAIVTMTTVGYGDIAPATVLGKLIASVAMILGYSILAVPTGIVTVEMSRASRTVTTQACPQCGINGHDPDAKHCKMCGGRL